MTVTEAAGVAGISVRHMRTLVTARKIKARLVTTPAGRYYSVDRRSVEAYRDSRQLTGYPRGKPRRKKAKSL